jgi:hypothetical protein
VFGQVHGGAEYHGGTQAGERRARDASSDVQRICCLQAKLLARTEHSRADQKQSMIVGFLPGYSSRGMGVKIAEKHLKGSRTNKCVCFLDGIFAISLDCEGLTIINGSMGQLIVYVLLRNFARNLKQSVQIPLQTLQGI